MGAAKNGALRVGVRRIVCFMAVAVQRLNRSQLVEIVNDQHDRFEQFG